MGKREYLDVLLKTESSNIDEVVVTGVYTRKKESFTGSSQTYKAEELKSVGNQNLIQMCIRDRYSNEQHVTAKTPPALLFHSDDDTVVPSMKMCIRDRYIGAEWSA